MWVEPVSPWAWFLLVHDRPGRAGALLGLLAGAKVSWQDVVWPGGQTASPGPRAFAALPAGVLGLLWPSLLPSDDHQDLDHLRRVLAFAADYPGISCGSCKEQVDAGEGQPDCHACPQPQPGPWVSAVLGLHGLLSSLPPAAARLGPMLWGGLDPNAAHRLATGLMEVERFKSSRQLAGPGPRARMPS